MLWYNTIVRVHWIAENLTLAERAEFIFNKHKKITDFFSNSTWFGDSRKIVDFGDKSGTVTKMLKSFKGRIRSQTDLKQISDDFVDSVSSYFNLYTPRFSSDSTTLSYHLGAESEFSEFSYLMITNFEHLIRDYNTMHSFVLLLIETFAPFSIEVTEVKFLRLLGLEGDEVWSGWMTYLHEGIPLPDMPSEINVEKIHGGNLLITTKEVFNTENSRHFQIASDLRNCLKDKVQLAL